MIAERFTAQAPQASTFTQAPVVPAALKNIYRLLSTNLLLLWSIKHTIPKLLRIKSINPDLPAGIFYNPEGMSLL